MKNFWSNNYIEYESNGDRNKTLSAEEYLNKIRLYSKGTKSKAKNFISSIGNNDERVMHPQSDNMEIMIDDEADEIMKKLYDSLKNRYQNDLISIKGSDFVYHYVPLFY